jgi:Ulp1 family protease
MFTKKFIFVPIHDGKHWSLIIICHPGMQDGTEPVLIHLDPMAGQKGEIQATVKQWGGGGIAQA